ncbi:bifunctional DNA primase/polymerase [Micromonospora sp. WMMD1102]|uniref:bifunctional DNA primase/polymerase n=1 Tax=Micromonospora sp. WMMD1102 TaxID=3016105 RepID=UPI00241513BD|nr:bifunctional DNA primase/polymerase [Micromonospora sp. WMMD1102]MDG4789010.1 bifunctional DNA primase/polymerase [Micromonospora sp. WMMD1102]
MRFVQLDRVRLRRIALRYAGHGWQVTPGACLARHRFVCGRAGCPTTGCHPALEQWEQHATADPARVATWWRLRPHSILLATGRAFDVLEAPACLGRFALEQARPRLFGTVSDEVHGPVAVTPGGRWMFLVRPGEPLRPELEQSLDVLRHGLASWIPAPPTRLPEGTVRWVVSPEETRWRLADPYAVQELLVDALDAVAPSLPEPLFPAHLPAPRQGR